MKKKTTVTVCSSAAFYRHVLEIEKRLKQLGFAVTVPKTAHVMQLNDNFDVSYYKTWEHDESTYDKKTELMKGHFKKVIEGDATLVVNDEKNGMPGYIGGNVLMELTLAFHYRKPIFILNDISNDLPLKEEIYGLHPTFLHGDLAVLAEKLG